MLKLSRIIAACLLMAPFTAFGEDADDVINGFDLSELSVPRDLVAHGGPPRDGIPALTDPEFIKAEDATELRPEHRVLGVAYNGVTKAYPLAIMTWHEIVNDRFGDAPVVVSYCPLCFTGITLKGTITGRRHHFGVSGLLYNNDVLLYDKETESLWSQVLATAVGGPLKGKKLEKVPTTNTTWGDWLARHPDTQVLSRDTGHGRDYDRNPYDQYDISTEIHFPVSFRAEGYHPKERVLGVNVQDKNKAYPFAELRRAELPILDEVNGKKLVINYDAEHDMAVAHDEHGKEVPGIVAYWFAWYAFYPDTQVYKAQ